MRRTYNCTRSGLFCAQADDLSLGDDAQHTAHQAAPCCGGHQDERLTGPKLPFLADENHREPLFARYDGLQAGSVLDECFLSLLLGTASPGIQPWNAWVALVGWIVIGVVLFGLRRNTGLLMKPGDLRSNQQM